MLSGQGLIGEDDRGESRAHLHGVWSGPDMTLFGGHLVENENPVPATAEVSVQKLLEMEMKRHYDKVTGFVLFRFAAAGFETGR